MAVTTLIINIANLISAFVAQCLQIIILGREERAADLKAASHSHDFHRSSSVMAEKSQIAVFIRDPRGLFPISGHNDMSIDGRSPVMRQK